MDPYAWSWNAEAVVILGIAVVYLAAVRRHSPGTWRVASFLAAMVLLLAVSVTPVHTLGMHFLLTMHLLQNVVLVEWAPLLVVLGIPPVLAASVARSALVRAVTSPWVALPAWVVNYMVWHLPWVYDAALRSPSALLHLEHVMYLATGLAMWWCVWQDLPHRLSAGARALYALAAFMLSAPLGLVLALVPDAIYDAYADAPERLWGLSRLTDQQLGGITMAGEQSLVFFVVFAFWFLRFLAEEERRQA